MNLSRHFTLDELTYSNKAKTEGIDNQPTPAETEFLRSPCISVLDPLRDAVGKPIKVNSGYRGPALNKRLNGVAKSQHLNEQAADIECPAITVLDIFKKVIQLQLPFDQVIYEVKGASKWVHVLHNPGTNRGVILLADAPGKVTYAGFTAQQAPEITELVSRSAVVEGPSEYVEMADEPELKGAPRGAGKSAATPGAAAKPAPKVTPRTAAKAPGKVKKAVSKRTPANSNL